jgi:hypothetical protein
MHYTPSSSSHLRQNDSRQEVFRQNDMLSFCSEHFSSFSIFYSSSFLAYKLFNCKFAFKQGLHYKTFSNKLECLSLAVLSTLTELHSKGWLTNIRLGFKRQTASSIAAYYDTELFTTVISLIVKVLAVSSFPELCTV